MIAAEGLSEPEKVPSIGELVSEIDDSILAMQENARTYLRRPTSGNFRDLLNITVDHIYAVNCTVDYILRSDEVNKTKVRMINSLLTQTARLHYKGLNAVVGSEEYATDGEFTYSITDRETGDLLDLEDPETEIIFPNPEETIQMISGIYGAQLSLDINALKELAEKQGIGRLISLGHRSTELASTHALEVAKTAAGVALGVIVANKIKGRKK